MSPLAPKWILVFPIDQESLREFMTRYEIECPPQFPVKGGHLAHSVCPAGEPWSSEASHRHLTRIDENRCNKKCPPLLWVLWRKGAGLSPP
jgi:hypothetical protein